MSTFSRMKNFRTPRRGFSPPASHAHDSPQRSRLSPHSFGHGQRPLPRPLPKACFIPIPGSRTTAVGVAHPRGGWMRPRDPSASGSSARPRLPRHAAQGHHTPTWLLALVGRHIGFNADAAVTTRRFVATSTPRRSSCGANAVAAHPSSPPAVAAAPSARPPHCGVWRVSRRGVATWLKPTRAARAGPRGPAPLPPGNRLAPSAECCRSPRSECERAVHEIVDGVR